MQPLCFDEPGALTVTFDARYDGAVNSINMTLTIDGAPQSLTNLNTFVGPTDDNPDASVMYVVADMPGNRQVIAVFPLPDEKVAPGTVNLTDPGSQAALLFFPQGAQDPDEFFYMSGTLTFTAASPVTNALVQGTVTARLWDSPWF